MNGMTVEETSSFRLAWSAAIETSAPRAGGVLVLQYAMTARVELYVTDRLWQRDADRRRVPDPLGVYRFVHEDSLRLVFDQAPWAPNLVPRFVFPPLASRIAEGETRKVRLELPLPVFECSALARDTQLPNESALVSTVVLVMGWRRRADMEAAPIAPTGETTDAGYVVYGSTPIVSSRPLPGGIPVRRRTAYMPRYALPGEPPPGPAPQLKVAR